MKICYLSSVLSVHDHRFLSKLIERNFETYLVTYFDGEIPEEIQKIKGLKIIHQRPRHFHKLQKFLFAIKVFQFRKIIKQINPDIIHSGFVWKDGFLAALSGFHPSLLMPWGSDVLIHPQKSLICRWIVKYTIKKADMITCDCQKVKNEIIELAGYPEDKIVVFPRGIDLLLFNPQKDGSGIRKNLGWERNKILIMTRSFYPVYRIDLFIEALPKIIKAEPSTRVILMGTGPEEDKLKMIIKHKNLDNFIHFARLAPNSEMPHYLNASDIYVSSSLSDGTSLSLLEAMACGLPVVVTKVPAIMEWVKDKVNGLVVPKENITALSNAIISLLKNSFFREKMRNRNLKVVQERANWEKNFNKLENIYSIMIQKEIKINKKGKIWLFGCPINNLTLKETIVVIEEFIKSRRPHQYIAINVDKINKLRKDLFFRNVILSSDLNIVDGQPLIWVSKLFGQPVKERFGGLDIINALAPVAEKEGYSIYFLGAREEIIRKVVKTYQNRYQKLKIIGWRNGYWKREEEKEVVENIKKTCPDVLFFAMSSPKKEIFLKKYLNEMGVSFVMGVGGAFDIIAGKTKRAPKWIQKVGLEWLFRLVQEPRRLWKRYLIGNTIFIFLFLKEFIKIKILKK